jgi:hypothetical protein
LVEQLTLNQRVAGSSPARLISNQYFTAAVRAAFLFVYTFIYTSVSKWPKNSVEESGINLLVRIFVEAIMANAEEIKERGRQAFESYIREHLVAIDQYDSVWR